MRLKKKAATFALKSLSYCRFRISFVIFFFFVLFLCYGYLHAAEGRCVHVSRWYRYCLCVCVCVCFRVGVSRSSMAFSGNLLSIFLPTHTWPDKATHRYTFTDSRQSSIEIQIQSRTEQKSVQIRNVYNATRRHIEWGIPYGCVPVVFCVSCFVLFVARWPDIISVMFRVVVGFFCLLACRWLDGHSGHWLWRSTILREMGICILRGEISRRGRMG